MTSIKPGMKVRFIDKVDVIGIVIAVHSNGNLDINWENGTEEKNIYPDEIVQFDKVKDRITLDQINTSLDKAKFLFEQAFKEIKLAKHQANNNFGGLDQLQNKQLINLKDLESTIENIGWSASSLYC